MVRVHTIGWVLFTASAVYSQDSATHLKAAVAAWGKKDAATALARVNQAIQADPKNKLAYFFRASLHESKEAHAEAAADFTKVIEIDPKEAEAYHQRGCLRFKLADMRGSLADFDKFLELRPDRKRSHWQRGITCYYAGAFDEGKKQFEGYQEFDDADVENAIWRFMCMVKKEGIGAARKAMLKIGPDKRVPMREIYDLYLGTKKPADVLAAANAADEKGRPHFYAHLYLGIWYDLIGDRKASLDHLNRAADDHRIGHYMWDVARVHRDLLQKKP